MLWRLLLLGAIGAASVALVPFEALVDTGMPTIQLRLLSVLQPLLLVGLATLLGLSAAPRVGLDAPAVRAAAEGRPVLPVLRGQAPAALAGAAAVAALLVVYAILMRPLFAEAAGPNGELARFEAPLATKLLYGGIAEELLTRWGLMSALALLSVRLGRAARAGSAHLWFGNAAAAAVFAAGHLPFLFLLVREPSALMVAAVLAGNLLPGLLFGWLYWRRGLEAAMLAHAGAHLLSTLASAAL